MARIETFQAKLKSGDAVTIRAGVESDAAALLNTLAVNLAQGEGQLWEEGEFAPTEEQERAWIRGMLENPGELLLVAEKDGEIIGNIDCHRGARRRLSHTAVFGMSVMPPWRSQGLGEILLKSVIEWAKGNPSLEKLELHVLSSNARAIALYSKLGFKEEGRLIKAIKYSDGRYDDDVCMGLFV
ncbi:MAG: GNAT family N-acetyltransferase [Bdellovibrionia bacterium]